jgi:hypothetical protein
MKRGDTAQVVKSWHSDVVPGVRGTVVKRRRSGYEIEITGVFANARGEKREETRCIFFAARHLKRAKRIYETKDITIPSAQI